MAQQSVDHRDRTGRAPVVDLERVVAGPGEQLGEVDQPRRIGAVVAVDRLVVVADAEHVAARCGEQADQQQVRGREILELVDEHHTTRPLRGTPGVGLRQQHEQGPIDLIVEVDRALSFEPAAERRPHAGQPVDVAVVLLLGLLG